VWPFRDKDLTPHWDADPAAIPDPPFPGRSEAAIARSGPQRPPPATASTATLDSPPTLVSVPARLHQRGSI
jgi:hypothetical protein